MASQGPTGAQPPEPKATTTPLFRPIEFEDNTGSEESECGESDSAYSSDNLLVPDVVQKSYNPKISTTLQNRNLWRHFCRNGNEMIVTKPGRRLFPALMVGLSGLNPDRDYSVSLRVVSADNQRYRYINMKWCATGESEVIQNEEKQIFHHPSSPNSGEFWMKRAISFKTIKVTHHVKSKHGNILLHTMHKYAMEIIVVPGDGSQLVILPLPETTFIAVSAYQNMELTQLKIDNNPFAKGFRYKAKTGVPNASMNKSSIVPMPGLQAPATNNAFTTDRSMMAYIQHMQQLHTLAAAQHLVPAVVTTPTITGESSSADAPSSSSTSSPNRPSIPVLAGNGITPNFPMFYPSPFVMPYHIAAINNSVKDEGH